VAALLPSLLMAALLTFIIASVGAPPFMGVIAGVGLTAYKAINSGALILGAILGALL